MRESVSSGLGRNGPWLQNAWLRVETRLDDGTLSPVAIAGAFRPAERWTATATFAGERAVALERCDYDVQPHEDALGRGRRMTLISRLPRAGVTLLREAVLYDDRPFAVARTGVTNGRAEPVRLDALEVFATPGGGRRRLQLGGLPAAWRFYRNGWQSWSPTMSFGGAEYDVRSAPTVLSPEAPQEGPGRFAADDVGVLYDPGSGWSLLAGAVSARRFVSQVVVDAPGRALAARNLCDGIALAPGETAWSERFAFDLTGHPNEQLARYGDALGREMAARVPARTPSGWCSWYYFYQDVGETDIVRNLREIERRRDELPVDVVQIDDGYQADVGDWTVINEKFPHGMQWLASEIRSAGFTPGLWLAPFLLSERSSTFAEHPEFVIRDGRGAPVVAMQNWGRANYGIDGTHPAAAAWLESLFREVCDGWGYEYVKIDFLFAAAIAGARHDASATRISAYRDALAAVRRGVGPERFILGCGSLMAPSVGYFDGNRIGLDCAPFWRFLTHEERQAPTPRRRGPDDLLSTETALRNTLTRWWMHGRLWANDPDCVLVREDRTKLTLDESRTMAAVIGLSAGMALSSDDLDRLSPERRMLLSLLLPPLPHAAVPTDLMERDMPERMEWKQGDGAEAARVTGLFNFEDEPRDLPYALPPGSWHVVDLWEERYLGVRSGSLTLEALAAHASRVLGLRADAGRPQVAGTNAHIGMGALDVSGEAYEAGSRTLTVRLEPAGRRARSVWLAGGRVAGAMADGARVAIADAGDGWCRVDVEVGEAVTLAVTFG